ncbi:LysR family transcriptional regulator ArgP [Gluconacetobacter sacchari]|uniref:LysR family transcriptional regulator ArgP n=2 Tax=Gluconacetobacter sacchari TaxID=92759 RepID=A0A7W4NJ54_9PROT|nr:LysR family transcriptional regulator ArgP [Gluconacetobacter sacchari]MBB2158711.1 LysR family transcriptional regulator ArgP [Gluconacetobacter sacchari]GBQ21715.1 transcriptional regulator [Gluconacetobacter sacchari DSM 12717]
MLDYAALAAVAAVAREGSFERAATALGVTASAVSQRVRALEDRLGAVLIVRGQPCTVTTIGARLCAHVERVRLLEGEMASALPGLASQIAGSGPPTIRVAVNADSLATWFIPAIAAFAGQGDRLVDLVIAGEDHTAERLRSGDVLAAVTTDHAPVQGCRTVSLGALRYAATASPAFAARWFACGIDAASLARAPVLRFDRRDDLHARWTRSLLGSIPDMPTHWIPSTHGFIDAALAGMGWCMNPIPLVAEHLQAGRLVSLAPDHPLDVPLYWQHARIGTRLLDTLTRDVVAAATGGLLRTA